MAGTWNRCRRFALTSVQFTRTRHLLIPKGSYKVLIDSGIFYHWPQPLSIILCLLDGSMLRLFDRQKSKHDINAELYSKIRQSQILWHHDYDSGIQVHRNMEPLFDFVKEVTKWQPFKWSVFECYVLTITELKCFEDIFNFWERRQKEQD